MKSFLFKFIFLLTIITISTFGLKYFLPHKKNYNSAMIDKLELLKNNKSKQKIILIGGSSVGWGLSAEQIEKATKITTINLGHHAGFGLMDYQEFVLSNLTPNDLIIFSPEWNFYDNPEFYDSATLYDLYANDKYLNLTQKSLLQYIKAIFLKKISFSKKGYESDNPYIYDCINKNGDIISHCGLAPRSPSSYNVDLANFNSELFCEKFKYISRCKCILLFPPTQKLIFEKNRKSFNKLQCAIEKSKLLFVDSIESNVYNENEFFDAEYHLQCDIKKLRTEKVIKYIFTSSKSNHTHQGSN